MNVSFLLQTRGRPELFQRLCTSIYTMAACPDKVEVIARADFDDPELCRYSVHHKNTLIIVGHKDNGYVSMGPHINETFRRAKGRIVCQICDDAFIESQYYDAFWLAMAKPISVISSIIKTNQIGGEFRFTFSAVPRKMCKVLGQYALEEDILIDRVWGCLAEQMDCEAASPVIINHDYQEDKTANDGLIAFMPERDENWKERMDECRAIAKRAEIRLRGIYG